MVTPRTFVSLSTWLKTLSSTGILSVRAGQRLGIGGFDSRHLHQGVFTVLGRGCSRKSEPEAPQPSERGSGRFLWVETALAARDALEVLDVAGDWDE